MLSEEKITLEKQKELFFQLIRSTVSSYFQLLKLNELFG